MSGTPSEAEIQTMWVNAVALLEGARVAADGFADVGGEMDVIIQALEGQFIPVSHANGVERYRSILSTLIDSGAALEFLQPVLFEYGNILSADATDGFGGGYTSIEELFSALYEWYVDNTLTVETRAITYDTSATAGGANVGNGAMQRLTVDANGHDLEACTVEKKTFRCRSDQNTGVQANAESFEFVGESASFDALLRGSFGSGEQARTFIRSKHAGTGAGGSVLSNSSFSDYSATATNRFSGWAETTATNSIAQDTTNFYRTHPGSSTDASLQITGGATVTMKQTLTNMRVGRIDPNVPWCFRVMLNKTIGTASGGTVTIRVGSVETSVTIAALGTNWQELIFAPAANNWPRSFNQAAFDVEIEWTSSTSGTLLVDDVIFAPYDLIDGTYWFLRGNSGTHATWLIDDTLTFTDTGGAPGTGTVQYWLWVAGLGYLPSSGTPSMADPA